MAASQSRTATQTSTYSRVVYVTRKLQADLFAIVDTYRQIDAAYAKNLIGDLRILMDEEVLETVKLLWMEKHSNKVTFGYSYDVLDGISGLVDDRSGGLRYRSQLENCDFAVRIWYSSRWNDLSDDARQEIKDRCHFPWGPGSTLSYSNGTWTTNRTYAKDDYGLQRSSFGG